MSRVKDNIHFLRFIASTPTVKQRQSVLRTASKEQIFSLAEIILNLLQGNLDVSNDTLKVLRSYRKHLRKVATPEKSKVSWTKRKEAVVKSAKAISLLLKDFEYIWRSDS